jgi:hypothetical protein
MGNFKTAQEKEIVGGMGRMGLFKSTNARE